MLDEALAGGGPAVAGPAVWSFLPLARTITTTTIATTSTTRTPDRAISGAMNERDLDGAWGAPYVVPYPGGCPYPAPDVGP